MSSTDHAVPSLMLMTLGAVILILAIMLIMFLRRRSNRHPMKGQPERHVGREIDEGKRGP